MDLSYVTAGIQDRELRYHPDFRNAGYLLVCKKIGISLGGTWRFLQPSIGCVKFLNSEQMNAVGRLPRRESLRLREHRIIVHIAQEILAATGMGNAGKRKSLFADRQFAQIGKTPFGYNDHPVIGVCRQVDARRMMFDDFGLSFFRCAVDGYDRRPKAPVVERTDEIGLAALRLGCILTNADIAAAVIAAELDKIGPDIAEKVDPYGGVDRDKGAVFVNGLRRIRIGGRSHLDARPQVHEVV